jgi:5-formyltetrahydrofolate cyclo-ligase
MPAATVSGVADHAPQVGPDAVDRVDVVLVGSVAVTADGARVGKGEGYSDLEFAVLRAFDRVDSGTTTATTVHETQVVDDVPPPADHDVPMDLLVTPDRVVRTGAGAKPSGIAWESLADERIEAMPILQSLAPE